MIRHSSDCLLQRTPRLNRASAGHRRRATTRPPRSVALEQGLCCNWRHEQDRRRCASGLMRGTPRSTQFPAPAALGQPPHLIRPLGTACPEGKVRSAGAGSSRRPPHRMTQSRELALLQAVTMVQPLVKVNSVKKRTARFKRHQSDRFHRVKVALGAWHGSLQRRGCCWGGERAAWASTSTWRGGGAPACPAAGELEAAQGH